MPRNETEDKTHDGYRLAEDFNLVSMVVNEGSYKAIRYQQLGYDHLWEGAIEELEKVQSMIEETLEYHAEADP